MQNKINMEKHTRGLKTERMFFKDSKNQPYELITIVDDKYVMRNLISGEDCIFNPPIFENSIKEPEETFVGITQAEVFDCIDNNDDEQHTKLMENLGIGYICPFCGGKLHWESDFMASEVHGMYNNYIEITNPQTIELLNEQESQYMSSRLMGMTDDIEKEKAKVEKSGNYEFTYLRENKGDDYTYYEIDDSVIGIYRCSNCGKLYEIQDCLPSEEKDYPYFS
jgi:rubrerythrin